MNIKKQCPTFHGIRLMSFNSGPSFQHYTVIMLPITDKIEEAIDKKEDVWIPWDNREFMVRPKDVYVYGHVDLESKEDIDSIYDCNFPIPDTGINIYADYNYKDNSVTLVDKKLRWYSTYDNLRIFKEAYGHLGVPKSIVIFKSYAGKVRRIEG